MKKIRIILCLMFVSTALLGATGIEDEISVALKTGNSKALARHFSANVDLTVLDKEDVYSKAQAELILKNFFARRPPKSFKIMHRGKSKLGMKYVIGTLETSKGTYRVTFNIKKSGEKEYLHQLRIDEE